MVVYTVKLIGRADLHKLTENGGWV